MGVIMANLVQNLKPISSVKAHITEIAKYVKDSKNLVVITHNRENNRNII